MFSSEPLEMFCMCQLMTALPHMGNKLLLLFWKWLTELKGGELGYMKSQDKSGAGQEANPDNLTVTPMH